jgi:IS1 family transposase
LKLVEDSGRAAAWYMNRVFRNLPCERLQIDETWGFTYCKEANRPTAKKRPMKSGDTWLWVVTDADTKLVPTFYIGPRDVESAELLCADLYERLDGRRVQITTDGLRAYQPAIGFTFGPYDVDYAQLQKQYGPSFEGRKRTAERRYSPAVCIGAKKAPIFGRPKAEHISTSFAERNNLNVRMHSRRMTRLTNAFSKKLDNHIHAMSLHFLYYNFVRRHQTLKVSPAMAAGVTKRLWEMKDVVDMLEAFEATQRRTQ